VSRPVRVLIVDGIRKDRALFLRAMRREFSAPEAVEIAGAAALEQALCGDPADVVITEYRLRWTDGLKAARSVKVRWATCPVVIFTRTGAKGLPSGR
jgi:DNA-binding NtrC family response regulator